MARGGRVAGTIAGQGRCIPALSNLAEAAAAGAAPPDLHSQPIVDLQEFVFFQFVQFSGWCSSAAGTVLSLCISL